jgi:hypothetical protein
MAKVKQEVKRGSNEVALLNNLQEIQDKIAELKKQEAVVKSEIVFVFKERIEEALQQKDEPFGSVNFEVENLKVTFTTPKKISYDQEGLKRLYEEGAPVKVEYDLPETVFKVLDQAGKDAFMPYRTLERGTISFKVEDLK